MLGSPYTGKEPQLPPSPTLRAVGHQDHSQNRQQKTVLAFGPASSPSRATAVTPGCACAWLAQLSPQIPLSDSPVRAGRPQDVDISPSLPCKPL